MLTIWKASAIKAKDPTTSPTPSSRTKNAASMASMIDMRVDFDQAILKASAGSSGRTGRTDAIVRVVFMKGGDPTF